MLQCTDCEILKDQISNLELMLATADQENRQLHARNVRLQNELDTMTRLKHLSYAQIKESFQR